jgi:hypothetical protein
MNLRVQTLPAHSCLTLNAFSISFDLSRAGQADCELPPSTESCIFLPGLNCVSDSLAGLPTDEEIRTDQSVEASAKRRIICGFHQCWCIPEKLLHDFTAIAADLP